MKKQSKHWLSTLTSFLLMMGLFQSPIDILAAPTVDTGSITITKSVNVADTYTDFEFSIQSPGNPSSLLVFGSEGTGPGQFDWSQAGVDVDTSGNVYIADEQNHRVQKFDKDGNFLLAWGSGVNGGSGYETCTSGCVAGVTGSAEGEFNLPSDLVVGSSNMVYVVDSLNHRIQKFNNTGVFQQAWGWGVDTGASASEVCTSGCQQGIFGSGDGQLFLPKGITFASDTLFVVDKGNNRIQYFDNNGVYGGKWGTSGTADGEFNNPSGIGIVADYVAVADTGNHRIQIFDDAGSFQRTWGWGVATGKSQFEVCTSDCQSGISGSGTAQFSSPVDVDGDILGYAYVADGNNRVMKFDAKGNPKLAWGSTGSGTGQFDGLGAIAINNMSHVITLDLNNYRVQTFVATSFLLNDYLDTFDGIPKTITYSLPVGTYTIKELYNDYWWNLPNINCSTNQSGDNPVVSSPEVTINLDTGENVNCTFNNAFEQGSITFIKEETPDDGTDFLFVWGDTDLPDFFNMWGERGSTDIQFNNPAGIEVDPINQTFIVDSNNHRIQKFNENQEFIAAWGWGVNNGASSYQICTSGCQAGKYGSSDGQFNSPVGAALDSTTHLYVGDRDNNRIQKFNQSGNFVNKWGSLGTAEGDFNQPTWIAVDQYDNIYVVDSGNYRIQKFDSEGIFERAWGWGVSGGAGIRSMHQLVFCGNKW